MRITPQQNASVAGIAALLIGICVWQIGGFLAPANAGPVHAFSYDLFNWTMRLGWIALAIVAVLCAAEQRIGLLLDAFVSGFIGAVFLSCGGGWFLRGVFQGDGLNLQAVLLVIFSFMFLGAARTCWQSYAPTAAVPDATPTASDQRVDRPAPRIPSHRPAPPPAPSAPIKPAVHPASVRPSSMPADGSAPPGGYLAALAREKDEQPRASHE